MFGQTHFFQAASNGLTTKAKCGILNTVREIPFTCGGAYKQSAGGKARKGK